MEVDSCRLLHAGKFNTRTYTEKGPAFMRTCDVVTLVESRALAYHEIISLIIILSVVETCDVEEKHI